VGVAILAACLLGAAPPPPSHTLEQVRARHVLLCGISPGRPGFAMPDRTGTPQGLDADTCHAIAAATLGDATRVKFVAVSSEGRFTALQSGAIDVLLGATTWTLGREARAGLMFAGVTFYDGTSFLLKRSAGVAAARQLDGATVCVAPGTSNELAVQDYFRVNEMSFRPLEIAEQGQSESAFLSGRCDVMAADRIRLVGFRVLQADHQADFLLLPEIISKEPLGPMVRKGDDRWFDIVRWTLFTVVTAEELGVSRRNLASMATSKNPAIRRLLGLEDNLGIALGLDRKFAYNIISQVGNYADIWAADLAPLGVARGLNALWTNGGLQYAPPMR